MKKEGALLVSKLVFYGIMAEYYPALRNSTPDEKQHAKTFSQ